MYRELQHCCLRCGLCCLEEPPPFGRVLTGKQQKRSKAKTNWIPLFSLRSMLFLSCPYKLAEKLVSLGSRGAKASSKRRQYTSIWVRQASFRRAACMTWDLRSRTQIAVGRKVSGCKSRLCQSEATPREGFSLIKALDTYLDSFRPMMTRRLCFQAWPYLAQALTGRLREALVAFPLQTTAPCGRQAVL